jgi:hypothetical protein
VRLELGYAAAENPGVRVIQQVNAWEAPRLPGLDHENMRRWATSATWFPPDSRILVRHRSLDGSCRVVTNDRNSPDGFIVEYDLGLVHSFAQPGTKRLIGSKHSYFSTPFEGGLDEGFVGLGYVEEAPLPMLEVLELREDPISGDHLLVAGPDDPLYHHAIPITSLGFIEGYPINPRHAPHSPINWGTVTLLRSADLALWRHRYQVGDERIDGSIALGGLWTRPANGLLPLYLNRVDRLTSELLPATLATVPRLSTRLRWAAAPLTWPKGRPRSWAVRAAASRGRKLIASDRSTLALQSQSHVDTLLGYAKKDNAPGWSAIYSATHPALGDQFVTRSELEATDMGYDIDGVLGYVIDRFADRSRDDLPDEIKWASHFGHRRRYVEGTRP